MYEGEKQRIRWADLEESQIEGVKIESLETTQEGVSGTGFEKLMTYDTVVEERLEVRKGGESQEETARGGSRETTERGRNDGGGFGRNKQRQESGLC